MKDQLVTPDLRAWQEIPAPEDPPGLRDLTAMLDVLEQLAREEPPDRLVTPETMVPQEGTESLVTLDLLDLLVLRAAE